MVRFMKGDTREETADGFVWIAGGTEWRLSRKLFHCGLAKGAHQDRTHFIESSLQFFQGRALSGAKLPGP